MTKYRLYSEWREVVRIGNGLADALMRGKTLQTPTQYAPKGPGWTQPVVIGGGETYEIKTVHSVGKPPYKRGDDTVDRAIVEFTDGQIKEVDAKLIETIE